MRGFLCYIIEEGVDERAVDQMHRFSQFKGQSVEHNDCPQSRVLLLNLREMAPRHLVGFGPLLSIPPTS